MDGIGRKGLSCLAAGLCLPVAVGAQTPAPVTAATTMDEIIVTPLESGAGIAREKVPYNVQTATAAEIAASQSFGVADFMNRNLASVTLNESQENPLQPDILYRGYTASPLLGLPQGMAVYQNGVRINEVLGDTVNWDLIPESSIARMSLVGGTNPVYGLNTLGGALTITTKNGFTHEGTGYDVTGGSFGRKTAEIESGDNNGRLGYYVTADGFDERGWRDASGSSAKRLFSALSYRSSAGTSLDLDLNFAHTDLTGNGPIPAPLLARDRAAVFTYPDNTQNTLKFVELQGERMLGGVDLSGNVFYRDSDTDYFNGNDSNFGDCASAGGPPGLLCPEDSAAPATDQFGAAIAASDPDGAPRDAVNNIDTRKQLGTGASVQASLSQSIAAGNRLVVGGGYSHGTATFASRLEIGKLNPDRSTKGSGIYVPAGGTAVHTLARTWSVYVTDTLSATARLAFTVAARYNDTEVALHDLGGTTPYSVPAPKLEGRHDYGRLNPAFGVTFIVRPAVSLYGSYSESSRAPTPIELACADAAAPCTLPNAFLADPPLEQVVTDSVEVGARGGISGLEYHFSLYRSDNTNDIVFNSTGGATATQGFFSNVGTTLRQGVELGLAGRWSRLEWFANLSALDAEYRTPFTAPSSNHPFADAEGHIEVQSGDRIPGVPARTLKLGGNYRFGERFSAGGSALYDSGVYLRGDEANLLGTLGGYTVVGLHATYRLAGRIELFGRVDNVFDSRYETFGLLGDSSGVAFDPPLGNDPRFLSPGAPRSVFVGLRGTFGASRTRR